MVNSKLYIYFPGFVGLGLIIRIKDDSVWLDLTNLLELRFAIVVILVMNIQIFEYSNIRHQNYEYSNIFVFQNYNIRIRISNIRTKLFEYSNIFEYSLITDLDLVL